VVGGSLTARPPSKRISTFKPDFASFHAWGASLRQTASGNCAQPEDELQKTYISGRQAGYINFLIGGKQRFAKSLISLRLRVADFYIFPGWLLHGAEPFHGQGERRSLAFNAFVGVRD
jgi:Putative 2OG-Fe(II) oxygenase